MAALDTIPGSRRLILDAGAVLALARGDGHARASLGRALGDGYVAVMPTPVLAQVHRSGRERATIDRVVNAVGLLLPTSAEVARRAGELLGRAGMTDAVDAIVAAEALSAAPAVILTSDPAELRRLIDTATEPASRVLVISV